MFPHRIKGWVTETSDADDHLVVLLTVFIRSLIRVVKKCQGCS